MKLEREKNTIRNAKWGIANKGIAVFLQFLIRTIIIKTLGADFLGINGLFTSVLQVLNMTELGFSSAMIFSMYKPIAEDDRNAICALMALYRRAYRVIGSLILLLGITILPWLKYLISGDYPKEINIYVLYFIYLVNTSVSYFLFSYKNCLLTAYQREDIVSKISTATKLLEYAVQIFLLFVTKNYYCYIIVQPIMTIVNNLVNAYFSDKLFPNFECRGKLSKKELKMIKKQVGGLMIGKIASTLRNSIDNIFLSAFLGLITVSIYSNYYYILEAIHGFVIIICNSMQAGIGNSIAMDSKEKNHEQMLYIQFIYLWIVGWCTICLLCLYQPFMKIWVGDDLMFPNSVMILFCVYFYVLCQGDINSMYSAATGIWWQTKSKNIVGILMNLSLNWFMVYKWGVQGIILASIISVLFITLVMGIPYLYKYYFTTSNMKSNYRELANTFIATVIAGGVTYSVCCLWHLNLTMRVAVCIIFPNIIYVIILGRTEYFQYFYSKVRKKGEIL